MTDPGEFFHASLARHLDPVGLTHRGVASVAAFDAGLPEAKRLAPLLAGARSAIVIGNGGPALWKAFQSYNALQNYNALYPAPDNPLDNFTEQAVNRAARDLADHGIAHRALFYWQKVDGRFVDFQRLAHLAGMGVPSRIGVLIHPVYGPWAALRAVLLTTLELPPTGPLANYAPCVGCEAPCMAACPVGAVTEAGWNLDACTTAKADRADCSRGCLARWECVVGRDYRYPPDAIEYHSLHTHRSIIEWRKTAKR